MSGQLDTLREQYKAWLAKWQAEGKPIRNYVAPCCRVTIATPAPPRGETWDSLTTCPDCGSLHFKVVTSSTVRAHLVSPATGKRA